MQGNVGWKTVELQIETLVPGILLVVELRALIAEWFGYRIAQAAWMPADTFVQASLFVAASYALGLWSSLVSRAVMDWISERGIRALIFPVFAHVSLAELTTYCEKTDPRFKTDHARESGRRWSRHAASWNSCLRSVIRTTSRRAEVDRRRSQGRLIRNLAPVLVLASLVSLDGSWSLLGAVIAVGVALATYTYSEYVIFTEAYDISMSESERTAF